mmetsp:Transcript_17670/g.35595  ORF Transcript_17670/g.35595 Transcript_17670/m.35595 type:complete len:125 (-) Transcript_17670:1768-2142(-)
MPNYTGRGPNCAVPRIKAPLQPTMPTSAKARALWRPASSVDLWFSSVRGSHPNLSADKLLLVPSLARTRALLTPNLETVLELVDCGLSGLAEQLVPLNEQGLDEHVDEAELTLRDLWLAAVHEG